MELAHSYAAITKSEKQADGTLKVYGKATDDSIDIDNQICDETWLAKAMPDWFTTGGNVREQHSNIAAGVATDYEAKADGHYITALVVDPVSVKKVETGVLKGFSIGILAPRVVRDNKATNGRIIDGQIVEVSLVDRPANPNAKLMLAKAAEGGTLMAVEQNIPSPADVAHAMSKSVAAEAPEVEALEAPLEEAVEPAEVEETVAEEVITPESEIVNASKALLSTLKKFDKQTYDNAVAALADLISIEAQEMKEGDNEHSSIRELLESVRHLFDWYKGEAVEGEVGEGIEVVEETMEEMMSSKAGDICECKCEKCAMGKGCDAEMCMCAGMKTVEPVETELDGEKSATADVPTLDFDTDLVAGIVEKAVSSARESVAAEIETLKAAAVAAEQKANQLEADLLEANNKAAGGGPKRATLSAPSLTVDNLLQKAAEYKSKADATQDKLLAKGYRELADDLTNKAQQAGK